ncbi:MULTISPECIES: FecCD family ABC transporter permease [Geobacillus]|uniref:Iron ABC transporter n=1 Tax=Geobacillus thermocatenulatus TaxID=33938 RepID=A0A226Q636_9BACL|nr:MULTISPECIES: iron ABC transporter permease [Geobacillus]ASS97683.1 iron ABC transporter [Geobacillus thermocatenulatus]KLR74934.1 iron ABC transporter [Geobacillus sp. T6]OXB87197.1 iron ABC transporter [Geobacillus thermocatenulatus]RAN30749.1 iron ABC transporter [Geobacillus sp. A8]
MEEMRRPLPFRYTFPLSVLILAAVWFSSMAIGVADTTWRDVWQALFSDQEGKTLDLIRELRIPRETAAAAVGAGLAVAGAIMQGMTRNPLADPGLLGLTAGANAALAATLAFFPSAGYIAITFACLAGSAAGAGMVFGIGAARKGGFSPLRIVLAGSAVSALLFAIAEGIGLYFHISKDVSMWTSGGVAGVSWNQLGIMIPLVLVGLGIAVAFSRQLTILSLSEDVAVGVGQKTSVVKAWLFFVVFLLTGASVAIAGNITFIGLMIPHLVRAIAGADYRFIIPLSAAIGASAMVMADTAARTIYAPFETPVAAIIAVIGLPFFLFVVRRKGRGWE